MAVESSQTVAPSGAPQSLPSRIVLFDGVCVFCDRFVRWLIDRDPAARLRFAPLQGETAAALRRAHPEIPDAVATLVYVDASDGSVRVFLRSEAALRVLAEIEGPWRRLACLSRLPRGCTDLAYRLFARVRYRVFGRRSDCRVPSAAERSRCLD
ncbi:MAG: thiol-disulfide oxidoreductase DCC family protein [Myxococcales bacterium]|nr:thiol-disulfide oxidoreductase DCC family protein [Myxococcales bacterium]